MTRFGSLAPDDLQVFLLGPGFGESVLLRVPGQPDGWMVVDSLLADRRGNAWCGPLRVLDELKAEPDLVLLTHPHLDHVGGMSLVVGRFGKRAAFGSLDFELEFAVSSRVRRAAQGTEASAALRAIAALPAASHWDLHAGPRPLGDGQVTVLHPSADRLKELQAMTSVGPNRLSSAVLVEWQGRTVLLGADLECPEWALLADGRTLHLCDPVKVPHHGSAGAFDKTWAGDRMTAPDNFRRRMLLAPFNGHPKLPDVDGADGLARLLGEVDAVHLTCVPFGTSPQATGTLNIEALRAARDNAKQARPPLPVVLGRSTAPQTNPRAEDSWLLAELSANGVCIVRGGAAHVSLTR